MGTAILFDIGSTFTKARAVSLEEGTLLAESIYRTTVDEDVSYGVEKVLAGLAEQGIEWRNAQTRLACSSAAGGLAMIAIGLVPALTLEAASRAALGAGAKLIATFSYRLSKEDVRVIEQLKPDIILLAGGTDGGNEEILLKNCISLADGYHKCPLLLAGNVKVRSEAEEILANAGFSVFATENVMPELDTLNIEPARRLIRRIFLEQITKARGMENLPSIDGVLMPTPAAVLEGAELLYRGTNNFSGLGEILVVDVGGATTDVHSIAAGHPKNVSIIPKGLPESLVKRTVEGDIGMRYNARNIRRVWGEEEFQRLTNRLADGEIDEGTLLKYLNKVQKNPACLAVGKEEIAIETALGYAAVAISSDRHCGHLEQFYTPQGPVFFQFGKDLSSVKTVIGCGGIIAGSSAPQNILQGVVDGKGEEMVLRPKNPELFVDSTYILFAVGLLAEKYPDTAFKLAMQSIKKLERSSF